ncbi:hypothetical protein [Streptomyces sp. NPDC050504]|uniref:hypothetical protein n=1 Tax=Streptomyces sp. NPDC050504 TaxID=3365618 RepID=UPI0037B929BB
MATFTFNVALGRVAHYASLPAANDGLTLVALEASGLESDSVLRKKTTLSDVVSGATNEQVTVGRKALTGVTVTVNHSLDRVEVDADNVTYTSPTGNPVGALVICYDPDTTTGTDADLIPLTKADLSWSPDGISLPLTIADFFRGASG